MTFKIVIVALVIVGFMVVLYDSAYHQGWDEGNSYAKSHRKKK